MMRFIGWGLLTVSIGFLSSGASLAAEEEDEASDPEELLDPTGEAFNPDPYSDVEQIMVTGQVQEGGLEDETTSAMNFSEEDLRMEGIREISDLSNFTPNLEIKTAFAASNPTLFIRGVGLDDYNANSAGAVAVYQDGIYMNSPVGQLFQLFDVQTVEVLRGPQARLRNANAGGIMIYSRKPTQALEGFTEISYGNYNRVTAMGAVNVPVVPDVVSSRLSFVLNKGDGITLNRCYEDAGNPDTACRTADPDVYLDEYVNDINNWAGRGQVLVTPQTESRWVPELLFNVHGGKNDSGSAQFQHRGFKNKSSDFDPQAPLVPSSDRQNYEDRDGDPFAGDYNAQGKEKLSLLGGSVRADWTVNDSLSFTSLSGYEWHARDTFSNDDASPREWFDKFNYKDNAWQFSEQLTGQWLFGDTGEFDVTGLFLMEELAVNNTFPNVKRGSRKPKIEQNYTQDTLSFAIFAHARSEIPEIDSLPEFVSNFAVEGTIRWAIENKVFDLSTQATTYSLNGAPRLLPQLDEAVEATWNAFSGDLSLTYLLGRHFDNEDVSVYFKYSRGWKPGHFNGGTALAIQLVEPVEPETVDAFEAGFHSIWLDQRLGADFTAFYYLFDNMQIFMLQQEGVGVPLPRLINAEDVRVKGVELELWAEPIDSLELRANVGWVQGKYKDFVSTIVQGSGSIFSQELDILVTDYSGNQMLASPEWSASGSASYTIDIGSLGYLRPRYSVSYKDDVFYDPNEGGGLRGNLDPGTIGQKAYTIQNVMLTYLTPNEQFEVTFWVRNFMNVHYKVQSFDLTERNFQFVLDAYAEPRTFGATVVIGF